MIQSRSFYKYILLPTLLACNLLTTANATAVTGEHTMNFDHTIDNPLSFVNSAGTVFTPFIITGGGSVSPDIGDNLLQDGIRTGVIGIGSSVPFDNLGTGHLHYTVGLSGFGVAFESDSGGAWIDAGGESFAFKSMYFGDISGTNNNIPVNVNVTGYRANGTSFSSVISNLAEFTTVDFLSQDPSFGDVTLIEMWFDSVGRGVTGPLGGNTTYDNIVIGSPVPLPAAFYLFMSGLIGLLGINNKRENHSI